MTNGSVWHQRDNTSSLFNNIKVPISKKVAEHWSKCHQSQSRSKTEVNFYSTLVISVTLAHCGSWQSPQGHNPPKIQQTTHYSSNKTGLDIFYSNPKTPRPPARHFSLAQTLFVPWRVFVSLPLSPGVCLLDTCLALAWSFRLHLISHREDLWRPSRRLALRVSANPCACVSS